MNTVTRPQLIATLHQTLEALDTVDAAWEGGSVSFGNVDGLSDVDAVAVVADDAIDATFAQVEAALQALSPIALRYDVLGTAGYAQHFYQMRDAGEFLVVDLVLMRRSDPLLFREVELHGRGRTWFDRRGILVEAHLDATQDMAQARVRVPVLAASFAMFQHIVTKERLRGHAVDALVFYHSMTWRRSSKRCACCTTRSDACSAHATSRAICHPRCGGASRLWLLCVTWTIWSKSTKRPGDGSTPAWSGCSAWGRAAGCRPTETACRKCLFPVRRCAASRCRRRARPRPGSGGVLLVGHRNRRTALGIAELRQSQPPTWR